MIVNAKRDSIPRKNSTNACKLLVAVIFQGDP